MIRIRLMSEADVPFGMRLKSANGWNQTEADWRRYLDLQPDGCFVAQVDGNPVGTLTTCIFGPVSWIAMVLVEGEHRGKGIGTTLMRHALEFLERQGVVSVRLDATPLGQPLYEKLGFVAQYTLHRYEGVLPPDEAVPGVETLSADQIEEVLALDRAVTRTDRRKLLVRLAREFPETLRVVRRAGNVVGFCTARPGARATQIGPCVASGSEPEALATGVGLLLLEESRRKHGGMPVFIDIPTGNEPAIRWAEESGLTVQRRLVRMCRGVAVEEELGALWASSGPEMG